VVLVAPDCAETVKVSWFDVREAEVIVLVFSAMIIRLVVAVTEGVA